MNIAYAAGLFDGEGYVRIARVTKRGYPNYVSWQVVTGIGMTHAQIIEAWHRKFGAHIYVNDHSKRNVKHRPQFFWVANSQKACAMLRQIRPFLVVKREEVELALELQASIDANKFKFGRRGPLYKDRLSILARREAIAAEVSALKHRNFSLSVMSPKVSE